MFEVSVKFIGVGFRGPSHSRVIHAEEGPRQEFPIVANDGRSRRMTWRVRHALASPPDSDSRLEKADADGKDAGAPIRRHARPDALLRILLTPPAARAESGKTC